MSTQATEAPAKVPDEIVKSVRAFVAGHGGSATAVLQSLGTEGVRVTLVGGDGVLGDRVVGSHAVAAALVERVDGLTAAEEWDRELSSAATPRRGHYAKMAGWVAKQTKFPRARNER
ncbi:hypothetical protein [Nocardia harenae]|uniref:hypothetical protein n=1 Tax=Nocardia harenae TaxID=358707 RepID=UPI00083639CE|nr:hypothetical protein [Nocardia harenae]